MFKPGDIVEFIGENKVWKGKRFRVIEQLKDSTTLLDPIQIVDNYKPGMKLHLYTSTLKLAVTKKSHWPSWY